MGSSATIWLRVVYVITGSMKIVAVEIEFHFCVRSCQLRSYVACCVVEVKHLLMVACIKHCIKSFFKCITSFISICFTQVFASCVQCLHSLARFTIQLCVGNIDGKVLGSCVCLVSRGIWLMLIIFFVTKYLVEYGCKDLGIEDWCTFLFVFHEFNHFMKPSTSMNVVCFKLEFHSYVIGCPWHFKTL